MMKRKGGWWCRICMNQKSKKYHQENKQDILNNKKEYRKENPGIIKERAIQQNKKRKKKAAEWARNRRKTNVFFKMRGIVSTSIGQSLKQNGSSKRKKSCWSFLPYTEKELFFYLEKQFEPWMNRNNHGNYRAKQWDDNDQSTWTWQIDHIIPHSTFNYTSMESQEFQDCWALSNLRPLSAKQNLIDGCSKIRHLTSSIATSYATI